MTAPTTKSSAYTPYCDYGEQHTQTTAIEVGVGHSGEKEACLTKMPATIVVLTTLLTAGIAIDNFKEFKPQTYTRAHPQQIERSERKATLVCVNPSEVNAFFLENAELREFISRNISVVMDITKAKSLSLEYFNDDEEDIEKLFVVIELGDEQFERIDEIEASLFENWFDPAPETIQSSLAVTFV